MCYWDVPSGSSGKESTCSSGDSGDGSIPGIEKILCMTKWQPIPVFSPGESRGQRSLAGYSPEGRKELNMTKHACIHVLNTMLTASF